VTVARGADQTLKRMAKIIGSPLGKAGS